MYHQHSPHNLNGHSGGLGTCGAPDRGAPDQSVLGALSHHMQAGVAAIDRQGLFVDVNDHYSRLHGVAPGADLRGHHFTSLTPERLRAPMLRLHDTLFETGREEPSYWQFPRHDGQDIFVRCQSVLSRCARGAPVRVVTMVDLTEHRSRERDWEQEKAAAEDAVRRLSISRREVLQAHRIAALDDLLRGVAHELNTPLGVCLTAATHLQRRVDEMGEALAGETLTREGLESFLKGARDTLALLRGSTERAGAVVETFRHVSSGSGQVEPTSIRLRPHVEAAIHELAPLMDGRRVEVTVKVPPDLRLTTCPGALGRVLSALLVNALTHGLPADLPNSRDGKVTIWAGEADGSVTLVVRDNGVGICGTDLRRIFDPFFHGGDGGNRHKGLGLYMAYNLVTGPLRGRISVESVRGHHTAFRILLPGAA